MSIEDWRRRIDEIDLKLVSLLNERARCALEIGHEKHLQGLPVYQPARENEILANVERANSGPLADTAIRRLFERIIDEARSLERAAQREDTAAVSGKDRSKSRS
jgi:chorismate mutase